jgi:RNA polymerase sigma-70 factor (ECF subfamily)
MQEGLMGKEAQFESIVMPHLDSAYNLARWITRNQHDAEDVVQEAMLRAHRFLDTFRGTDPRPWLLAIVRNAAYTWLEKNRPAETVEFDESAHSAGEAERSYSPYSEQNPEVIMLHSATTRLVNQALEALPVLYREVIVMRELEDLSYKEIATVAAIPIGTVMSRLARGREMLRSCLEVRMRKAS